MAKRRKQTPQRSHVYQSGEFRPGFTRRQPPKPAPSRFPRSWIVVGAIGVLALFAVAAYALGWIPGMGPQPAPSASPVAVATPRPSFNVGPPSATPLASPPATPAGDGTTATIETELGNITFELYTESAPVASENFINLADAGFYNGTVFHRIVPDFVIQGGDADGDGVGGAGYTIPDEPVVGQYGTGILAMARTQEPNSQGSQFFIVLSDSENTRRALEDVRTYVIFGKVTQGMEVAQAIAAGEASQQIAVDPVAMTRVTIQRP